ncbi:MAG: nitrous oxide-stimulated promoter family protein [Phycisphaerae bacterium]|jgi:hypothetical protein
MIRLVNRVIRPASPERILARDLRTLASFIQIYCDGRHRSLERNTPTLKTHDLDDIAARPLTLCRACQRLLTHAFVMRARCTLDPKPSCKKCPNHCYAPKYREQIRTVMRYSGKRLVLRGYVGYLWHLLI